MMDALTATHCTEWFWPPMTMMMMMPPTKILLLLLQYACPTRNDSSAAVEVVRGMDARRLLGGLNQVFVWLE